MSGLWRILRGEDQRGRKLRWMAGLLRPYRGRVALAVVAILAATGAGLAPPYLAGQAIDAGIVTGDSGALTMIVVAFLAVAASSLSPPTPRPTWSAGSAPAPCKTCASTSSPTCSRCRSGSSRGAARGS